MRMRRRVSEDDATWVLEFPFVGDTSTSDSSTAGATFAFFSGTLALTRVPSRPKSTSSCPPNWRMRSRMPGMPTPSDAHARPSTFTVSAPLEFLPLSDRFRAFTRIGGPDYVDLGIGTSGITVNVGEALLNDAASATLTSVERRPRSAEMLMLWRRMALQLEILRRTQRTSGAESVDPSSNGDVEQIRRVCELSRRSCERCRGLRLGLRRAPAFLYREDARRGRSDIGCCQAIFSGR